MWESINAFVTTLELRIGGIFLPGSQPNIGSSIAISEPIIAGLVSEETTQPNEVGYSSRATYPDWVGARLCLAQLGMLNYV